jgi:hypothetical protein
MYIHRKTSVIEFRLHNKLFNLDYAPTNYLEKVRLYLFFTRLLHWMFNSFGFYLYIQKLKCTDDFILSHFYYYKTYRCSNFFLRHEALYSTQMPGENAILLNTSFKKKHLYRSQSSRRDERDKRKKHEKSFRTIVVYALRNLREPMVANIDLSFIQRRARLSQKRRVKLKKQVLVVGKKRKLVKRLSLLNYFPLRAKSKKKLSSFKQQKGHSKAKLYTFMQKQIKGKKKRLFTRSGKRQYMVKRIRSLKHTFTKPIIGRIVNRYLQFSLKIFFLHFFAHFYHYKASVLVHSIYKYLFKSKRLQIERQIVFSRAKYLRKERWGYDFIFFSYYSFTFCNLLYLIPFLKYHLQGVKKPTRLFPKLINIFRTLYYLKKNINSYKVILKGVWNRHGRTHSTHFSFGSPTFRVSNYSASHILYDLIHITGPYGIYSVKFWIIFSPVFRGQIDKSAPESLFLTI